MKKVIQLFLSFVMVCTLLPSNLFLQPTKANDSLLEEVILEPMTLPNVSFQCSAVTRVAANGDSMKAGNTIVKASTSRIPELMGSYSDLAYDGEAPFSTRLYFSCDPDISIKQISCNNDTVVLSDAKYDETMKRYIWEIVGGRAEVGSTLIFTIDYEDLNGNQYQSQCLSFVEGIANGGAYGEAQTEIQSLSGTSSIYRVWASASTRLLGESVYYELPTPSTSLTTEKGYGTYDVATGTYEIEDTEEYQNATAIMIQKSVSKPAGKHDVANDVVMDHTTTAHVYIDKSIVQNLSALGLRLNSNVGKLSIYNNENPYTALAETTITCDSNENVTAEDAKKKLGFTIPEKADYGVTQYAKDAAMLTLTEGKPEYSKITTNLFTGSVADIEDGDTYTINNKYYSYMYVKQGLLKEFNITSSITIPTTIKFHVVDKTNLKETLNNVLNSEPDSPYINTAKKGVNPQEWYYSSGYDEFKSSYLNALAVRNNNQSTQEEIDNACEELKDSYDNLVLKSADESKLWEQYNRATDVLENADDYKEESVTLLQEVYDKVEFDYSFFYQSAVDTMASNLEKAISALEYKDANYSEVDDAIAAANALDRDLYVDFSSVEAAINAVEYGKDIRYQDEVDAMAQAINDAILALEYKGADYSEVDNAIAAANALDRDLYVSFYFVEEAINAVEYGKDIRYQDEVDAMAQAIYHEITLLEYKDANYSEVDNAIAAANALNKELYVNFSHVEDAINAVVKGKDIRYQDEVDAMAQAINDAITALEYKAADYSNIEYLISYANTLDKELYVNFSLVEEAINAVVYGKDIREQNLVLKYEQAIHEAITALEYKAANYSEVDNAIAAANALNKEDYVDFSQVEAAMNAVVRGKDIRYQDEVDAMAKAIQDAILALEEKSIVPAKVENLVAEDTNYKTVTLTWDAAEGATAYDVYRKSYKEGATFEYEATVEVTTYESVGVMTGKEYAFYVVAKNEVGEAEASDVVAMATTLKGTVKLEMEQVSTSKFHLSWNKVDGATRYIVYRKRNDDKMKKVLTLGTNVLEYTTAEMPNGEYEFQVKAGRYDSVDRVMTDASNKVSGTVEAIKPTVTATAGTKSAKISWKKMEGVTHYQVYRATSSTGKYTKLVTTKELSYTAKSLTAGKKYYFKVRGYKTYKSGTDIQYSVYTPYSSVKSVTAK